MRKYVFYDESGMQGTGCDCCEDFYVEEYYCSDTECQYSHSFIECYVSAITTEIGVDNISDEYEESLWNMSIEELKNEASKIGVAVEVVS